MICSLRQAANFTEKNYTIAISGGFDPIHVGHIRYIKDAASIGGTLIVIVNSDWFLIKKKGRAFMPLQDRMEIVNAIKGVDYVCPCDGWTVDEALEILEPNVFAKGGDRNSPDNIPEWGTCNRLGITVRTGVGGGKERSSSRLLSAWGER